MSAQVIDIGIAARDGAIAKVDRAADEVWKWTAFEVVKFLSKRGKPFTTDAVHYLLARDHPEVETHEPRALGAIMRRAVANGLIEPTEQHVLSKRPECHRRPIRVWRPLPQGDDR